MSPVPDGGAGVDGRAGVAVVTDSTASLPAGAVEAYGITVVPLRVAVGDRAGDDGTEVGPGDVAEALRAGVRVTTSRPAPDRFAAVYAALAAAGHGAIVSVHVSGRMSGTADAARTAARTAPVPVEVVDSGGIGMLLGFAVLAAADAARSGRDLTRSAAAARTRAAAGDAFVYVDTLEYLRRGGRLGAAAGRVGDVLGVKPLLQVRDGQLALLEKVRTPARALVRLEDRAASAASGAPGTLVDLAVQHLAAHDRAAELTDRLRVRVRGLDRVVTGEVGGVVGAHVGPGMIAVTVSRRRPSHP